MNIAAPELPQILFMCGCVLFALGILGMIGRQNLLSILMFQELTLNGANLCLVAASILHHNLLGSVLVFMVFLVAAAELAVAILIILLLIRDKKSLDVSLYADLKG